MGASVAEALRIEHLSKTFPGQVALDDVSIDVAVGEVHALVGQNGSGKSTLIKILAGYHQPDSGSGSAWAMGNPLALGDSAAAAAAGIRFVHQDLGLVGTVSAVENLALTVGYQTTAGRIRWRDEVARTRQALAGLGLVDVDVKAPLNSLPPSQRTAVAIARALVGWEGAATLLVLDEPTATLPGDDVERLFEIIHRLKARGVSILYVSHHLDEVFELADRVTVLRDGQVAANTAVNELDHHGLVELIVGHRVETTSATESSVGEAPLLTVRELRGGTVTGIDFDIYPGEIVGVAGITGSGREHVLGLIAGQLPRDDGHVVLDSVEVANFRPRQAIDAGVAFVPAERGLRGTVATMNVRENLSITDVGRHKRGGRVRRKSELDETRHWIDRLGIKTSSTEALIGSLSGGNQQKVMFGKALRLAPKLLLLDEPTQGIDIGAKDQIHRLIDESAGTGMSVLIASTDTDELVRLCHRVLVMTDGHINSTLVGEHIAVGHIQQTQLASSRRGS
jgi:ribose transport system ATP-binding protein